MVQCDRGPPTMERLGAPDQGAYPRASGLIGGDQTNILEITLNDQLTGPIPESIGRFSRLQRLRIDNYLEGPIPQSIST